MSSHIVTGFAGNTQYVLLENVTEQEGVLTGLAIAGGRYDHYFKVTLDGRVLVDEFLCGTRGDRQNNGMGVNLPFANGLKIEIKDEPQPDPLARFWVAYTLSVSKEMRREPVIKKFGDISYMYEQALYEFEGKQYQISHLTGPERLSKVILDRDCILSVEEEPLTGRVELWRRKRSDEPPYQYYVEPDSAPSVDLVIRPLGTKRKFIIFKNREVPEKESFEYSFLVQGVFDVVAEIPGFVNIPGTVSIL